MLQGIESVENSNHCKGELKPVRGFFIDGIKLILY